MMKKIILVVVYFSLCAAVSIFSPHLVKAKYYVDNTLCMTCHSHGDFASNHDDCSVCHSSHGSELIVSTENCSECHSSIGEDEYNLVDYHESMGADCLSCHVNSHIETCLVCHKKDDIHIQHSSCTQCHEPSSQGGVIKFLPADPEKCIVCHPLGDPGKCNLAGNHGSSCLECHTECAEDGSTTTTTTGDTAHIETCVACHEPSDLHARAGHSNCSHCHAGAPQVGNVAPDTCVVCHPLGGPGTCNLAVNHGSSCLECHTECTEGGSTTTTTTGNTAHIGTCVACHEPSDLHASAGHSNCSHCHAGAPQAGNVAPDTCVVCHPLGGPGTCNLAVNHGSSCLECHTECTEGGSTTTTTSPSKGHIDMCIGCHVAIDLHEIGGHSNCARCHTGDEIGVGNCAVCHPTGEPGKCNLAIAHGSSCLACHSECADGTTTSTVYPFEEHIERCFECHMVDDLHTIQNHSTCAQCHEGSIVWVGNCAVCHPTGEPGKCNLAIAHGSSCLACHPDCSENTTTTTAEVTSTTTTMKDFPPIVIDINLYPDSALRSHLIHLLLITFIEGTDSNFNQTTTVSFEGDAICPPLYLVLSPTSILVISLINPADLEAAGNSDVTVNVSSMVDSDTGETYEEVGSWYLTLIMLPWILDEE